MRWRTLVEFVGFNAVWLAAATGAAHGTNLPGVLSAALFVATQVWSAHSRRPVVMAVVAAMAGACVESAFALSGAVRHEASWPAPGIAPPWIIALWFAYGTTLATTDRLLGTNALVKAAIIGAVCGPLAYVAGARLGALALPGAPVTGLLPIAVAWAMALPALVSLDRRLARAL